MYHNISKMHLSPSFVTTITHEKHFRVNKSTLDHKNTMNLNYKAKLMRINIINTRSRSHFIL
ncbi:hypothetical protein BCU63_06150 [Vibrio splendidus]|nr:hypothetical protein BCU63_06150 [Vibrio splendidus]